MSGLNRLPDDTNHLSNAPVSGSRKDIIPQLPIGEQFERLMKGTPDEKKLAERRVSGEIDQHDFDLNILAQLIEYDQPLRRSDLGNQALVLREEDFQKLGSFSFVHSSGEVMDVGPESLRDFVLIIFPEELGDD